MDIREVMGKWWVSTDPTNVLSGTFTLDPDTGGVLRITGRLAFTDSPPGQFVRGQTIHGSVIGDRPEITLLDAVDAGTKGRGIAVVDGEPRPAHVEQYVRAPTVLAGREQPTGTPPRFDRLTLSLDGLADWAWADSRLIEESYGTSDHGGWVQSITITDPPRYEFDIPAGALSFGTRGSWNVGAGKVSAERDAVWTYEPSEPKTLDELQHIIRALRYFHVVVTGQPTSETLVEVGQTAKEGGRPRTWTIASIVQRGDKPSRYAHSEQLLVLDQLPSLERAVRLWLNLFDECRFSLFGILSVLNNETKLHSEVEFFTLAQAAEAYHRSRPQFDSHVEEYAENVQAIKRRLAAAPPELRNWAAGRLRDEPSFRDRIRQLVRYTGQFGERTTSYGNFPGIVGQFRDVWAHGLPRPYEGEEWLFAVHWTSVKLRLILHACLLGELGLGEDEVLTAMTRSTQRQFESNFDPVS